MQCIAREVLGHLILNEMSINSSKMHCNCVWIPQTFDCWSSLWWWHKHNRFIHRWMNYWRNLMSSFLQRHYVWGWRVREQLNYLPHAHYSSAMTLMEAVRLCVFQMTKHVLQTKWMNITGWKVWSQHIQHKCCNYKLSSHSTNISNIATNMVPLHKVYKTPSHNPCSSSLTVVSLIEGQIF